MTRLSNTTLDRLPAKVARPSYDRASTRIGIVHLGLGAFHRAHQAAYTDAVLAGGDLAWGICGVSLRSPETRDALQPQDGLYTLAVRDGSGDRFQIVGAILESLVAPEDPETVLKRMSAPETRIVSLTVTEKGYCHLPATGELDEAHPDIRHDLAQPERPKSAVGFLVEALARRRRAGIAPFTVLSCDNLPANGQTAGRVVARFAALRDPELGRFVQSEVAFPSSMVDRIVPATTDADRALVAEALGQEDRWPVMAEPFTQWVVEDRFPAGRPAWDATFVEEVEPFELMKLRLLNGSHSTLSYLGYLAGHETVADAMRAPGFEALLRGLMREEASPTLPPLPGFDLAAYRDQLIDRFRNPALRHRTWQIAMDGSQKLPQRLLGTIRDRLAAGQPFDRLALGVAAWMVYVRGADERGEAIDVRDPLARDLAEATRGCREAADLLAACLRFETVFGRDLPASPEFRATVERALDGLLRDGAARTVERFGTV
ncbi:mannitol dehydrogenase family protein [Aureimonas jatrophae]|uniref:Fructuronate reductase n=1 Tax=Aureimonas jatrophae TaxID=1166073 RepID=A0A1H0FEW4_9HYPH|nr:mannitol dehydrogenase family protein [Aureimonas jatrophae]MBB3950049.1 fructuronate reductase [Aureimonas jatrophae]SDN93156.1 fructuronate reductase [Aureimonas jatrophae]